MRALGGDRPNASPENSSREGEWQEVTLPFDSLEPSFRGCVPRLAAPLDTRRIRQVGSLIGDKREAPPGWRSPG
jgi:hypothetical protein